MRRYRFWLIWWVLFILWLLSMLLPAKAHAQQYHQVTIGWTPSTTSPIDGYNVYRATCNVPQAKKASSVQGATCANGGFHLLSAVSASSVKYTDLSVQPGVSYEYYLMAYALADTTPESIPSNTLVVTVAPFGATGARGVGH